MKYLFIEYPKCSTCKNAKKWLDENNIEYEDRHILENNPTKAEISNWIKKYNLDIKKLFNTSGMMYKELNLKEKLVNMSDEEKIDVLASNGMLLKRPIILNDKIFLNGFRKTNWEENIKS